MSLLHGERCSWLLSPPQTGMLERKGMKWLAHRNKLERVWLRKAKVTQPVEH